MAITSAMTPRGGRVRAGFTAIEMMMVFAILMIVSSLTIPAAFSSMRYASFSKAMSDVFALHNDARNAAMLGQGTTNIGVRWSFEGGSWVGVLLDGATAIAGTERRLPASLLLMSNDAEITDTIEWWYHRNSGRLVNDATNDVPAMVGLPVPELYLAPHGPAMIKSQSGIQPGFELTNRRGDMRAAIRIYPIGLLTMSRVGGEDEEQP